MALTLAKKEKIGVFVLATDENGDQATLSYRQIFPDKKSSIMRKHSSVFYSTDVNKTRKGKVPQESKIYLDNDSVEANPKPASAVRRGQRRALGDCFSRPLSRFAKRAQEFCTTLGYLLNRRP